MVLSKWNKDNATLNRDCVTLLTNLPDKRYCSPGKLLCQCLIHVPQKMNSNSKMFQKRRYSRKLHNTSRMTLLLLAQLSRMLGAGVLFFTVMLKIMPTSNMSEPENPLGYYMSEFYGRHNVLQKETAQMPQNLLVTSDKSITKTMQEAGVLFLAVTLEVTRTPTSDMSVLDIAQPYDVKTLWIIHFATRGWFYQWKSRCSKSYTPFPEQPYPQILVHFICSYGIVDEGWILVTTELNGKTPCQVHTPSTFLLSVNTYNRQSGHVC